MPGPFRYQVTAGGGLSHGASGFLGTAGGVDDFERGDLTPYVETPVPDARVITSTDGPVRQGTYACETTPSSSHVRLNSFSGLPNYPVQGDTFRAYQYLTNGATDKTVLGWAAQDVGGGPEYPRYSVHIDCPNDDVTLMKVTANADGSVNFNVLAGDGNVGLSNHVNVWLEWEVDWGADGAMGITLTDTGTGTTFASIPKSSATTDTQYTEGGIVWKGRNDATSSTIYHDNYHIVS